MTADELVVVGFAAYRLTRLVVQDDILERPRNAILRRFPDGDTFLGTVLSCPWCAGVWLSAAMLVGWRSQSKWARAVVSVLAVAGVQGLLAQAEVKLTPE